MQKARVRKTGLECISGQDAHLGEAQSRRKPTSTHEWHYEWHHEWAHEWTHEWTHEIAHQSAHDRTLEVDLPVSTLMDSHESSHETSTKAPTKVPTKVSSQVVEVHLSCFHLFCSSANIVIEMTSCIVTLTHPCSKRRVTLRSQKSARDLGSTPCGSFQVGYPTIVSK